MFYLWFLNWGSNFSSFLYSSQIDSNSWLNKLWFLVTSNSDCNIQKIKLDNVKKKPLNFDFKEKKIMSNVLC
jgi:hypothetical protein